MSITKKHFDERMDDFKQLIEDLRKGNSTLKVENAGFENRP